MFSWDFAYFCPQPSFFSRHEASAQCVVGPPTCPHIDVRVQPSSEWRWWRGENSRKHGGCSPPEGIGDDGHHQGFCEFFSGDPKGYRKLWKCVFSPSDWERCVIQPALFCTVCAAAPLHTSPVNWLCWQSSELQGSGKSWSVLLSPEAPPPPVHCIDRLGEIHSGISPTGSWAKGRCRLSGARRRSDARTSRCEDEAGNVSLLHSETSCYLGFVVRQVDLVRNSLPEAA